MTLSGSSERKCGVNGVWEGAEPKCIGMKIWDEKTLVKDVFHWAEFSARCDILIVCEFSCRTN